MARLQKLNSLSESLNTIETSVDGLKEQLSNLVKASALVLSGDADDETVSSEQELDDQSESEDEDGKAAAASSACVDATSYSIEHPVDDKVLERNVLTEARFGLRPNEVTAHENTVHGRRRTADFGDAEEDHQSSKAFASTLNSIAQRTATRTRQAAPQVDDMAMHENDELRRGLEMMEAELGHDFDKDSVDAVDDDDPEVDHADEDEFYARAAKKSKAKKDAKKVMYQVAPKVPRVEREIDGERAINKTIMKNRGLVAHKSKLNRNPRVKKREQYRKALIRRKGAVREVRADEGHKYGGESTGIKSNLSRSRKLIS
jgi:U3 small nucleolar RNA-associated protein 3